MSGLCSHGVLNAGSGVPLFLESFRMRRVLVALAIVGCAMVSSSNASAGIFNRKKDCSGAAASCCAPAPAPACDAAPACEPAPASCGGSAKREGLLARLHARKKSCSAPAAASACCDAAPAPAPCAVEAPCAAPAPAPCAAPAASCCDAAPAAASCCDAAPKAARPKVLAGLLAKCKTRRASCSAPAAPSCCDAAPVAAAPSCGCN